MPRLRLRPAFTLVELLVVIAIIAVLIGLLLPAVQRVREASNRARCQNNLKQLGIACMMYEGDKGTLPPGGNAGPGGIWTDKDKGSWLMYTLPYLEQTPLYQTVPSLDDPAIDSIGPTNLPRTRLPYGQCPSDDDALSSGRVMVNYIASLGPTGGPPYTACGDPFDMSVATAQYAGIAVNTWYGQTRDINQVPGLFCMYDLKMKLRDVSDGLSNTLMLGETLPRQHRFYVDGSWASYYSNGRGSTTIIPINTLTPNWGPFPHTAQACTGPDGSMVLGNWAVSTGFKSRHANGSNFVFGDGAVRFLDRNINMMTYQLLGSRRDGRAVSTDP